MDSQRPTRQNGNSVAWKGWLSASAIITVWEALCDSGFIETAILPAPHVVAVALFELIRSGSLVTDAAMSLWRVLVGYSAAVVLGIVSGLLMAQNDRARAYLGAL